MKGESCACVYSKIEENQCISHQSCSQLSSEGPENDEIGLAKQGWHDRPREPTGSPRSLAFLLYTGEQGLVQTYWKTVGRRLSRQSACCTRMRARIWIPIIHTTPRAVGEQKGPWGLLDTHPSHLVSSGFSKRPYEGRLSPSEPLILSILTSYKSLQTSFSSQDRDKH